jgi:transposase-like protein
MKKGTRRRIKIIDPSPLEESIIKILFLGVAEVNKKLSLRPPREFHKWMDEIKAMF